MNLIRFSRRIRIAPGIQLNLGLRGAGLSVGPRGLHVGLNRQGMYASAGIPGIGIYAVHHIRKPGEAQASVEGKRRQFPGRRAGCRRLFHRAGGRGVASMTDAP